MAVEPGLGGAGGIAPWMEKDGFGTSGLGALLAGGSVADATANASGGVDAVFGKKTKTAPYIPIDVAAEIGKSAEANLSNTDRIAALLDKIVPGFSEMLKKGSANTLSLLSGEIPQDVQDKVQRSAAYQSLMGGYAGSSMARALTARDLGRTSLDMMMLGNNSAQTWSQMAQKSYSPFTTTFADQVGITAANNAGAQATQQFKYNVEAAPDPGAAGKFAIDSAIGMQMLSFGMGAAGGAMGGAGGGKPQTGGMNYNGYNVPQGTQWTYDASTGRYMPVMRATPAWGG